MCLWGVKLSQVSHGLYISLNDINSIVAATKLAAVTLRPGITQVTAMHCCGGRLNLQWSIGSCLQLSHNLRTIQVKSEYNSTDITLQWSGRCTDQQWKISTLLQHGWRNLGRYRPWPWNQVKIRPENPEKWQYFAGKDPENPEIGMRKWLGTLCGILPPP